MQMIFRTIRKCNITYWAQSNLIRKSFNLFYKQLYFSIKRTRKTKMKQISKHFQKRTNLQPNCTNPSLRFTVALETGLPKQRKLVSMVTRPQKGLRKSAKQFLCLRRGKCGSIGKCRVNNLYRYLICGFRSYGGPYVNIQTAKIITLPFGFAVVG